MVQTKIVTVTVENPVPVPASMTTPKAKPPPNLDKGATGFDLSHNNLLWQQAYSTLANQLQAIADWSAKAVERLKKVTTTPPQTSGQPQQ